MGTKGDMESSHAKNTAQNPARYAVVRCNEVADARRLGTQIKRFEGMGMDFHGRHQMGCNTHSLLGHSEESRSTRRATSDRDSARLGFCRACADPMMPSHKLADVNTT